MLLLGIIETDQEILKPPLLHFQESRITPQISLIEAHTVAACMVFIIIPSVNHCHRYLLGPFERRTTVYYILTGSILVGLMPNSREQNSLEWKPARIFIHAQSLLPEGACSTHIHSTVTHIPKTKAISFFPFLMRIRQFISVLNTNMTLFPNSLPLRECPE